MNTLNDTTHHHAHHEAESTLLGPVRLAAIGAVGGAMGSMAAGASFYAGPLGVALSALAGAALLALLGRPHR